MAGDQINDIAGKVVRLSDNFALLLGFLFSFAVCCSLLSVSGAGLFLFVAALLLVLLTALWPCCFLMFFLALLPLFGNRPGSSQSFVLIVLGSALNLGLLTALLRRRLRKGSATKNYTKLQALHFFLSLFVLASLLSLVATPLLDIVRNFASQLPSMKSLSSWSYALQLFVRAGEEELRYTLLSVAYTTLAYSVFLFISGDREALFCPESDGKKRAWSVRYLAAILAGLLLTLIVGFLSYYQLIDLSFLRNLDPTANAGDIEFRLQSFFGHSGWLAEYITLSVSTVMLLLLLPQRFLYRLLLILLVLLVGELALILSYQRGGWLSYPLTLLAIWAAIYVTWQREKGQFSLRAALRRSTLKILFSLPLTIVLSMLLLWGLSQWASRGVQEGFLERYASRARDVVQVGDRSEFVWAGLKLASLHPFLGAGSESFAHQYEQEFVWPGGHFKGELDLPLHGSAHNVYAQVLSGKGICGLFLFLAVLLTALSSGFLGVLCEEARSREEEIVLLICSCAALAALIYGMVQELFYVQSLQYLFFAFLGIQSLHSSAQQEFSRNVLKFFLAFVAFCFLAHLYWEYVQPGRARAFFSAQRSFGCFAAEPDERGDTFRWCGVRSRQKLPLRREKKLETLSLRFKIGQMAPGAGKATLRISSLGEILWEEPVSPEKMYRIVLAVPEKVLRQAAKRGWNEELPVDFKTASYFIPATFDPRSTDRRVLSYRLYEEP